MSALQRQMFDMLFALPEKSLIYLKPLLDELLTAVVLTRDPQANVSEMDEDDKVMFLKAIEKQDDGEYITFDQALKEAGFKSDEIQD